MSDPNSIEHSEKIGVGTYPLSGTGDMLNHVTKLHANWFYTWNGSLPSLELSAWTLGSGALVSFGSDHDLSLSGKEGWAYQSFDVTGSRTYQLTFDAQSAGAGGGVLVSYFDAFGKSLGAGFIEVTAAKSSYSETVLLPMGAVSAQLLAYAADQTGIVVDEFVFKLDGINAVVNGGFENVTDVNSEATASFVPMIWDEDTLASLPLLTVGSPAVLTFNEPDNRDQANMSVSDALSGWPQLMSSGVRLGSPATTMSNTLGETSWLNRFMTEADARGYRVDFIAVHYYPETSDIAAFKSFLEKVHQTYNRPIWVTEWALADWDQPGRFSAAQQKAFFEAGSQMMDDLVFVERHAWFAAYDDLDGWDLNSSLISADGSLTELGRSFAQLAEPNPPQSVDPSDPLRIYSTSNQDVFQASDTSEIFVFGKTQVGGRDKILGFGSDDLIATSDALQDRNGDGIITFGKNKILELSNGAGSLEVDGINPIAGLRFLGHKDGLFYYADATVRPKGSATRAVQEGSVNDDNLVTRVAGTTFFFDLAAGVETGHDVIANFSHHGLLVTTISVGGAARGDLISLADGYLSMNADSSVMIKDSAGLPVEALEFDGMLSAHGVSYFVYSQAGSAIGVSEFLL